MNVRQSSSRVTINQKARGGAILALKRSRALARVIHRENRITERNNTRAGNESIIGEFLGGDPPARWNRIINPALILK
ncbi:hypothetical protein WN51_10915 [Melipona quadrifasciata]|uniref:Uncharacterized protein n=1 Tax=Melipona quadrifasciata TaxID=166423 RepID=A0A0M9A796_9HYME|nr:hypothetical protein WN51_10915 [Melipona quadrifasciata]